MIKFKINNFKFIIAIICMNTINTLISTYNKTIWKYFLH